MCTPNSNSQPILLTGIDDPWSCIVDPPYVPDIGSWLELSHSLGYDRFGSIASLIRDALR